MADEEEDGTENLFDFASNEPDDPDTVWFTEEPTLTEQSDLFDYEE